LYSLVDAAASQGFAINSATGQIYVASGASLNFEAIPSYAFVFTATDSGAPTLSCSASVSVNVNDVNEPPVVPATTILINENSVVGTVVSDNITYSDPDFNQYVSFSFANGSSGFPFVIDSCSGMVSVGVADLDFELQNAYYTN
jgi:hypothetical protein